MKKFECEICGYIYDEAKGEYTERIEGGTSLESLGMEFRCPVCDASVERFFEIKELDSGSQTDSFEGGMNGR